MPRLHPHPRRDLCTPDAFAVTVVSELDQDTVQERWQAVNVVLRFAMLVGLPMQVEAALNLIVDSASEIVPYDQALGYFWNEEQQKLELRITRLQGAESGRQLRDGGLLNLWACKYGRPLLMRSGLDTQADMVLEDMRAKAAVAVPLFVSNRVMGSLQLYARTRDAFTPKDAQLLWILSLTAEALLTRNYGNEGLLGYAFTDYLTGLKTRGYFEQQLELEIKRCERKGSQFALLMIDIDFFKQLNDTHGHHAGDQVLRDVASLLMRDMREVDTVARYGGEEFVLILPDTGDAGARMVGERLRRTVEHAKFFAGSPTKIERLSISLGIAIYDQDAHFRRDLIESADAALYAAKSQGRNRTVLYSEIARQKRREVS